MARINRVKKARKPQGNCGKCGKAIEIGMAYIHWSNRATKAGRGWRRVRCTDRECFPRRSEYSTTSDKLAQLMDAQDDAGNTIDNTAEISELEAALESAAEIARSVGEEYEESAQNIEDGFGHETYVSEEIREKAQACESWADALESAAQDLEEFEDEQDEDEDDEEYEARREEHFEEQRSKATDALSECELV